MKINLVTGATFLLCTFLSFGQSYDVEWSTLEKSPGRMLDILPRTANDFFALRRSGRGGLFSKLEVSSHKKLELAKEGKLELRVNGSPARFEGSSIVGDHFMLFLSDKKDGQNGFYMQEYDESLEPTGKVLELASYSIEGKRSRYAGSFSVSQSQNREFLTVTWTIPGKKDERTTYGYKIFNTQLELTSEGEYQLPFETKFSTINSMYLSNTGDFFVTVTEYGESEKKGLFKSYKNYRSMHIYHITPDDLEEMEIDLEGKRVEAMSINSDNEKKFVITGIYGEKEKSGVTGLFYLKADFKSQEIISEGFEKFSEDFIMQDWSDRTKKKAAKKKAKGKEVIPKLYSYSMRDVHILDDGTVVGSMEQYYVRVVTYTDPKTGSTRTTYYYYYNDIITYKVGEDGGFDWLTRVNKYQVSTNDGGYFSSYVRFLDGNKMCFLFNDNSDNYDETSGEFNNEEKVKSARLSKKRNTVGIVEIDLESGEMTRRMFTDREDLGAIAVPKLFNVDYNNNELLLYAIKGSKEKFGILRFGDNE